MKHPGFPSPVAYGALLALLALEACGGGAPPRNYPSARPDLPPRATGFARLAPLQSSSSPRGDLEEGLPGDWVLSNSRMWVVVSRAERRGGFSMSGGNILDAIPEGGEDLLHEVFTYFDDTFPRQAAYVSVEPGPPTGRGGVRLVARGSDTDDPRLEVTTDYTLDPDSPFLEIRTVLRNRGPETLSDFELGDAIEWGRAEAYGPGFGGRLAGESPTIPFLLGVGERAAYAWVSPEGDLTGPHGDSWSDAIVRTVTLAPGDSTEFVRRLVVAKGASEAAALAWSQRGVELGALNLTVEGEHGDRVGGVHFEVKGPGGEPLLAGFLPSTGTDRLLLPPGEVTIEVHHPGRGRAVADDLRVEIGRQASRTLRIPEPAALSLSSSDEAGTPCPARWAFEGLDGTPTPDFGPDYRIDGAGPWLFTPRGRREAQVPPGRYRVTVTRGPAYEAWRKEIKVRAGDHEELTAILPRLPIPAGWVSADLHVHAVPSHDSAIALADRAGSLVCEGIEWFAATDHYARTDFGPVLDTLALAAPLEALVGEEVTTAKLGHFGLFPASRHPDQPGNGGLRPDGLAVDALFDRMREEGEGALIQVNHPRASSNGYFARMEYSAAEDTAKAGFRRDFDLLELLNGKDNPELEAVWADWIALLKSGDPVTAVGNSDSHRIHGQEPGSPRTWVWIDPELAGSPRDRFVEALRTGRAVVTNGPFVEFTLEGSGLGGTAVASGGRVRGRLRVIAPSWVDVRRVRLFVNGREQSTYMVRGTGTPVRFDEDVEIPVSRPGFVIARVEGDLPMDPVVQDFERGGRSRPVRPLAVTNPIWVETSAN